jgi:hypothetical protein
LVDQSLVPFELQSLVRLGEFWVELLESFDEPFELFDESLELLDESLDPFEEFESDELLEPELELLPCDARTAGAAASASAPQMSVAVGQQKG